MKVTHLVGAAAPAAPRRGRTDPRQPPAGLPDLHAQRHLRAAEAGLRPGRAGRGCSRASARRSPVDASSPGAPQRREVHPVRPLRAGVRRGAGRPQPVGSRSAASSTVVAPAHEANMIDSVCIHCGQCANVCPTAAFVETASTGPVLRGPANPDLHVVVQTAPAIRATIGEGFGFRPGTPVAGKLVTALRRVGFAQGVRHQLRRRPHHRGGVRRSSSAACRRTSACRSSPPARRAGSTSWSASIRS